MQGLPMCCMLTCITLATLPLNALLHPCIKHPTCWKSANLRLLRFLKMVTCIRHHIGISYHNPEFSCTGMLDFITQYNPCCTVTNFVDWWFMCQHVAGIIWFNTLTDDSSISRVATVMNTKRVSATIHKFGFLPSTDHIVQKNGSSSLAKVCTPLGNCTCWDKCTFKPTE